MDFSPFNTIIKYCIQGMDLEEKGQLEAALQLFMQGWKEATNDHERFLTAHYIARRQPSTPERLHWLEKALEHALKTKDSSVTSAFPALYTKIADCYKELGDQENAEKFQKQSFAFQLHPTDKGPFYHGTKAHLKVGDLLFPGGSSNYKSEITMRHIYFTALVNGAGLAAALAQGNAEEHVYIVAPTGDFENDPNLTNKKFPGNPSRSYRSLSPLRIIGEVKDWTRPTIEELAQFRERLEKNNGEIIN